MVALYNIFISLLQAFFKLAALRSAKAKAGLLGRKNTFAQLAAFNPEKSPVIWVHSASTGEFEQAKPLIEAIRSTYPQYKIIATFFSPSGFDAAKNYKEIDARFYLPFDTAANAAQFVKELNPSLVIFSKYDFWHHHLKESQQAGVPLLLISGIFLPKHSFFKWYGSFQRSMLRRFTHLFVQDKVSQQLLQQHGVTAVSISGDTRFDRVLAIRNNRNPIEPVQQFVGTTPVLIAGSTWPSDEVLLQPLQEKIRMIIAPHEITPDHIQALQKAFPNSVLFSEIPNDPSFAENNVLIINNIGMLSRLYQYATITYVGGGFTPSGIHNTLEAAVWGKPVIFGPIHDKFIEAKGLIDAGGGFCVKTASDLESLTNHLLHNKAALKAASDAAANYVLQNGGATERIMRYIQENRLLTR